MRAAQKAGWILLLGLVASASAEAAGYEVNGVRLGMTQEQVQALFGDKIECAARKPTDTDPSQVSCVSTAFAKNKVLTDTFAGQKTVIWYNLLDGQVARITFLGFPSLAFDDMVRSMESKYGKANVVSDDVRVSVRAELVSKHATWTGEGGELIYFQKYSPGNLDRSYLNFYGASFPKAMRPEP